MTSISGESELSRDTDRLHCYPKSSKMGGRVKMNVNVLLSGRLRLDGYGKGKPENDDGTFRLSLSKGSTVREVVQGMNVPLSKVTMMMLNARKCKAATPVRPGDRVILIPSLCLRRD